MAKNSEPKSEVLHIIQPTTSSMLGVCNSDLKMWATTKMHAEGDQVDEEN